MMLTLFHSYLNYLSKIPHQLIYEYPKKACQASPSASEHTYYILLGTLQFTFPLIFIVYLYGSLAITYYRDEQNFTVIQRMAGALSGQCSNHRQGI